MSVDLQELNPEALSAVKAPTRRQAHSRLSVTRVGFEPDLTGLKDQRPHQKSNERCGCVGTHL